MIVSNNKLVNCDDSSASTKGLRFRALLGIGTPTFCDVSAVKDIIFQPEDEKKMTGKFFLEQMLL